MAILNNILKGQLIWSNHLWDIKVQEGCVFLRHPVVEDENKMICWENLEKGAGDIYWG